MNFLRHFLLILVCFHFIMGRCECANVSTIRVSGPPVNFSDTLYGLWKPLSVEDRELYFGLFYSPDVLNLALKEINVFDAKAYDVDIPANLPKAFVPVIKKVSFRELGYDTPLSIYGYNGFIDIHIPWSEGFSVSGSSFTLFFQSVPSVLDNSSSLTVWVEGVPVKILNTREIRKGSVRISLSKLNKIDVGDYLDIRIKANLVITGDRCVDFQTGNLWIYIAPESFVEVSVSDFPRGFWDILKAPGGYLNVLNMLKKPEDNKSLSAMLMFSSLIGAMHPYRPDSILSFGAYDLYNSNIIIGDFSFDGHVVGRDLYLSPKGLISLTRMWHKFLIPFHSWKVISEADHSEVLQESQRVLDFREMGIGNITLKGLGEVTRTVSFNASSLGGIPEKLILTLIYSNSPIKKSDTAFIKVSFNGVPVLAWFLPDDTGIHKTSLELPVRFTGARNTLSFTLTYYPERGECRGVVPEAEVSILEDSFLTAVDVNGRNINVNFDRVPALLNGKGLVVISNRWAHQIAPVMRVVEKISKLRGDLLNLKMVKADDFFGSDSASYQYDFLIAILDGSDAHLLKPIVDISEGFTIINPQTKEKFLSFSTDDMVFTFQSFKDDTGNPIVLVSSNISNPETRLWFEVLRKLKLVGGANVGVCLSDKNYPEECSWQYFEVGQRMRVIPEGGKDLWYYWIRYRIYAFVLLGIMVFLFLWYVYRRLT